MDNKLNTVIGVVIYRGADKSLAWPGRKQATVTEDFFFIYPIYNHNSRNISTIYIPYFSIDNAHLMYNSHPK